MIDVRLLYPVEKVDGRASHQIINLIMRYLLQNGTTGSIDISRKGIIFSRFLWTTGKISYEDNQLEYRDNTIYFTGDYIPPLLFNYDKSVLLLNIILKLKSGFVGKFPF